MSDRPIDLDERRMGRLRPLRVRSIGDLPDEEPTRDWVIPSILLRRSITLLTGDGGMGKSLLCLQLQVAAAIGGADFLGLQMPAAPMSSFGMYCEDDDDEIHRRLAAVCRFYGVSFRSLSDRVRWISRVGEDNELVTFKRAKYAPPDSATAVTTPLFDQIRDEIEGYAHQLIIIDTAADVFAGNENIRPQVRAFVNKIRSFSMYANGGVVLNAHPSKSAIADGSGFSGSTAWNGSVRNRLYLTKPKPSATEAQEGGEEQPRTDERVLRVMKSNYGPFGQKIRCKYVDGAFETLERPVTGGSLIDKLQVANLLLTVAENLVKNGTYISTDRQSRTALVPLARKTQLTCEYPPSVLDAAQLHLFEGGRLVRVQARHDRKWRDCMRPSHLRYPEEREVPSSLFQGEGTK